MTPGRIRIFSLPGVLLGLALAILFFMAYGRLTRPAVARAVQLVLDLFADSVQIGSRITTLRARIPGELQFVPHLGYIAHALGSRPGLPAGSQLWLLLDASDREKRDPAGARVDAVEVLSAAPLAYGTFSGNTMYIFDKAPVKGCLSMDRPGRFRHVLHWAAPNDRGGIVVTTDDVEDAGPDYTGPAVATLLAYAGKFDSSRTLRGTFTPAPCKLLVLGDREGHAPTAAERALAAFADSVGSAAEGPVSYPSQRTRSAIGSNANAALSACADPGWNPEGWHEAHAGQLRILLPPGFPEGPGGRGPSYRWALWGGGADLQVFPVRSAKEVLAKARISSTCSTERTQGTVAIRIGERRDASGVFLVGAYFRVGRSPGFAIVATTTDTARRTMLLHTIYAAIESPVWSLQPR